MLERLLRLAAIVCSLFVLVGWGWFALDETSAASQGSAQEILGQDATRTAVPDARQERAREATDGRVREGVDDVNDVLLRPFAALADGSGSAWVRRSVPAVLALLVYGLGLSMLARYATGRL